MKKAQSKNRSSLSRPNKSSRTNTQAYSPEPNDSFSEIPRAVGQSYDSDFFLTNTQRKTTTTNFFQPADSEEEYGRIIPSSLKKSSKHDQPIIDQEANHKMWRFFAAINDRSSQNQDEADELSNGISLASRRQSQKQLRIIHNANDSQVSHIIQRPSPAPTSDKTQEYKESLQKNRVQKIHCLQTSSKVMDLRISPKATEILRQTIIKPNLKSERLSMPFHKRHRPRVSQKKRDNNEREFIVLKAMDVFEEQRLNPFPKRKTRMPPLRFWLGQRIIYGKEGAKAKWVLKK